ncbi:Rieske (2Fe-2S) protein [Actinoplanes sp. NBRC 103695]|uniref:Rieske (2Fe-2S) protein n=1 Tax=Actinoplanes sp. NBRC 103695 TaxID=3032202 RepID=UPI0024A06192|nr:Rieske (2Fe-2S) protein [Actinoplanes sp. NBRC 103695]GLY93580.1 iron-sulfur protein [Actinoplanes sp. NBRC 103695]
MTDVQTRPEATCQHGRSGAPRRAVFAGAGAVGAACLLAACGTSSSGAGDEPGFTNDPIPAGSASPGAGSTGGGDSSGGGAALAAVADVPEGGGIIKGDLVITQPQAGTFKAFSKVCTHQGCDVSKVDGGVIFCPCHKSEFSITDGSPQGGPAKQPLPETKVKVDGDNIVAA